MWMRNGIESNEGQSDRRSAPGWIALIGISTVLIAVALGGIDRQIAAVSQGAGKLDLMWSYGPSQVAALFARYAEEGLRLYRVSNAVDCLFALGVGAFGALLVARVWPRARWLGLAPIGFALLDLLENGLIAVLIGVGDPIGQTQLVQLASVVTRVKLVLLGGTDLLVVIALGTATLRWIQGLFETIDPSDRDQGEALWALTFAVLALVLALWLSPIQSAIWNQADAPTWLAWLPWTHSVGPLSTTDAYAVFGRAFVGVPLALLLGLDRLRRTAASPIEGRLLGGILVGLLVTTFADIGTYWVAGLENPGLRFYTFWIVEVPAWLIVGGLGTALGIRIRGCWDRLVAWSWMALLPMMLGMAAALQYLPHALSIPLALTAVVTAGREARRVRSVGMGTSLRTSREPCPGVPAS